MFERFTDRARHAVAQAQLEARGLNHDHIATEHILLGLIHDDTNAAVQILELLNVDPIEARRQVEEIIGGGRQALSGHIPFTPRAKKALDLASRESLHIGHNYIGTEHLLLGLIREGDGVAAQVLAKRGVSLDRARRQATQLLGDASALGRERTPPGLRPARDRVLTVVEPVWRVFYHRRPSERAVLLASLIGGALAVRRRLCRR